MTETVRRLNRNIGDLAGTANQFHNLFRNTTRAIYSGTQTVATGANVDTVYRTHENGIGGDYNRSASYEARTATQLGRDVGQFERENANSFQRVVQQGDVNANNQQPVFVQQQNGTWTQVSQTTHARSSNNYRGTNGRSTASDLPLANNQDYGPPITRALTVRDLVRATINATVVDAAGNHNPRAVAEAQRIALYFYDRYLGNEGKITINDDSTKNKPVTIMYKPENTTPNDGDTPQQRAAHLLAKLSAAIASPKATNYNRADLRSNPEDYLKLSALTVGQLNAVPWPTIAPAASVAPAASAGASAASAPVAGATVTPSAGDQQTVAGIQNYMQRLYEHKLVTSQGKDSTFSTMDAAKGLKTDGRGNIVFPNVPAIELTLTQKDDAGQKIGEIKVALGNPRRPMTVNDMLTVLDELGNTALETDKATRTGAIARAKAGSQPVVNAGAAQNGGEPVVALVRHMAAVTVAAGKGQPDPKEVQALGAQVDALPKNADGKIVLPNGVVDTGQKNAKGTPVTVTFNGGAVTPDGLGEVLAPMVESLRQQAGIQPPPVAPAQERAINAFVAANFENMLHPPQGTTTAAAEKALKEKFAAIADQNSKFTPPAGHSFTVRMEDKEVTIRFPEGAKDLTFAQATGMVTDQLNTQGVKAGRDNKDLPPAPRSAAGAAAGNTGAAAAATAAAAEAAAVSAAQQIVLNQKFQAIMQGLSANTGGKNSTAAAAAQQAGQAPDPRQMDGEVGKKTAPLLAEMREQMKMDKNGPVTVELLNKMQEAIQAKTLAFEDGRITIKAKQTAAVSSPVATTASSLAFMTEPLSDKGRIAKLEALAAQYVAAHKGDFPNLNPKEVAKDGKLSPAELEVLATIPEINGNAAAIAAIQQLQASGTQVADAGARGQVHHMKLPGTGIQIG